MGIAIKTNQGMNYVVTLEDPEPKSKEYKLITKYIFSFPLQISSINISVPTYARYSVVGDSLFNRIVMSPSLWNLQLIGDSSTVYL